MLPVIVVPITALPMGVAAVRAMVWVGPRRYSPAPCWASCLRPLRTSPVVLVPVSL